MQLAEKQCQLDALDVRAPSDGNVLRRDLNSLLGTYLKLGDVVTSIGDEQRKELQISVAQDDLEVFLERTQQFVTVDIPHYPPRQGTLEKVIPRATRQVPHPALAAINGGPLPTRVVSRTDENTDHTKNELLSPRFTAIVPLDQSKSRRLCAGQTGSAAYRPYNRSIGEHVYHMMSRWIRERFHEQR